MNAETGHIYHGDEEIQAALKRGEPLVPVNEKSENERQDFEPFPKGRAVSFQSILNEKRRQKQQEMRHGI